MTGPLSVGQKTNGWSERSARFRRSLCRFKHNLPSLPLKTGHHDQAFDDAIAESDSLSDKPFEAVMTQLLTGRRRRGDRNHTSTAPYRTQPRRPIQRSGKSASYGSPVFGQDCSTTVPMSSTSSTVWASASGKHLQRLLVHFSTLLNHTISPPDHATLLPLRRAFIPPSPPLGTVQSRLTRWQQSTCVGSPRW